MNVLLLSHQLDFSGAPIALLRLAETLVNQGHTVSLLSLKNGPLGTDFGKLGVKQFSTADAQQYDLYVANTVVTVPLALKLAPSVEKITAWIHESRDFFKLYGLDENKFGLSQLRRAFFPAQFMLEQYRELMPNCELGQLRNVVSMQGVEVRNEYKDCFAVAGSWETRKNQSSILKLLEQTQLNIRLNFIGAKKPAGLTDSPHHFCGQVPALESKGLIAGSSGLISAAKSEAQPLTVIEAAMSSKPVLLSNIAAHRELCQLIPSLVIFDSNSPSSFAQGYKDLQNLSTYELNEGAQLAECYFGHTAFAQKVQTLVQ